MNRILTRLLYAGHLEYAEWGVTRRPAKHEGLVSLQTFERIQERLAEGAYVPARKDLNSDFALRGFVTCGCCDKPLTACWSKSKTELLVDKIVDAVSPSVAKAYEKRLSALECMEK